MARVVQMLILLAILLGAFTWVGVGVLLAR